MHVDAHAAGHPRVLARARALPGGRAHAGGAALAVLAWLAQACSGEPDTPLAGSGAPTADVVAPPAGVADRGLDPAVVAIAIGVDGGVSCAGALIAPDIVLTARRCVNAASAASAACSVVPLPPSVLSFRLADDAAQAPERARGRGLIPPLDEPCTSDVALVLLDRPIDDVQPLVVRTTRAAQGDHVRAVGFGVHTSGLRRVRDHLAILDSSSTDLRLAEWAAPGDPSGGPAIDETTGEVVGVASGSSGPDTTRAYARADAVLPLVERALAESFTAGSSARAGVLKAKKGPADMGAGCETGMDCAAGVCVSQGVRQYCSRTCGTHDHCPTRFRCLRSQGGASVCVES